jgi:hypothetical protein
MQVKTARDDRDHRCDRYSASPRRSTLDAAHILAVDQGDVDGKNRLVPRGLGTTPAGTWQFAVNHLL